MEASIRVFNSSHRYFSNSILLREYPLKLSPRSPHSSPFSSHSRSRHTPILPLSLSQCNRRNTVRSNTYCSAGPDIPSSISHSSVPPPFLGFLQSLSNSITSSDRFARIVSGSKSDPKDKPFHWNFASNGVDDARMGILGEKRPIVTVVLLGWLGSKPKHLRRYAEMYNSQGIHAVTFVASVRDVLSFDLGRKLQERISVLAGELASWLSESDKDGRERFLLFHTFSNTGWLAYGAILDNLQGRQDLLEKIKGCVVDSGGDPEINPKVWAAGFVAALLKKRSSATYPSVEMGEGNKLESMKQKKPPLIETLLLVAFEKLFSYLLHLPDINRRLERIIATLWKKQPPYPQLYLYSRADRVIPYESVESFVEEQRKMGGGRKVMAFNFKSSPHVDHYRTFPHIYSLQLQNFLKECLDVVWEHTENWNSKANL